MKSKSRFLACWGGLGMTMLAGVALAQPPIAEMQSAEATVRGAVAVSGAAVQLMSGAQVSTQRNAAALRLVRGGELKLCPATDVTLTASTSGQEHLVAVNAGAVEARYALGGSSDLLMTTDFRVQLTGPGDVGLALRTETRGEVCVEAAANNSAAVVVQELFGDGSRQIRPGERILFREGAVGLASVATLACGCPGATIAQQRPATGLGFPEQQSRLAAEAIAAGRPAPEPPLLPTVEDAPETGQPRVQIEAPMVFRGDPGVLPPIAEPPPRAQLLAASLAQMAVPSVEAPPKPRKRNFFARLGSVFRKLFQ